MSKDPYSFYARWWRCDNEEKLDMLEELLDAFCTPDREIIKIFLSIKEYSYIERPSIRKAASIIGLSPTAVSKRLKKIRKKLPKNFF